MKRLGGTNGFVFVMRLRVRGERYFLLKPRSCRTKTSFREGADWEPWLLFFLRSLKSQTESLRKRLENHAESLPAAPASWAAPEDLSPLAGRLLEVLKTRGTLSVSEAARALGANRHTLKDKFSELVQQGHAELRGKGRGAHYRARR